MNKYFKKFITMFVLLSIVAISLASNNLKAQAATTKLNKSSITIIKGNTYNLKLKNNTKKVKWSSSNKKIATVNSNGKVTAKKVGTATVIAKVGKIKYTCKITVEKPSLNKSKATVYTGNTTTLQLKNTTLKVKWSTSNKKIATVNSNGKVTAKKAGTCKITAKINNKKYTCKITVKTKDKNILSYMDIILTRNNKIEQNLVNEGFYIYSGIKWYSSNNQIATVSSRGIVTAKKVGDTKITAKYSNKKYTFNIKVIPNKILYEDDLVKVSLGSIYNYQSPIYFKSNFNYSKKGIVGLSITNKTAESFTFVTESLGINGLDVYNNWTMTKISPNTTSNYHLIELADSLNINNIQTLSGSMYMFDNNYMTIENISFSNINIK